MRTNSTTPVYTQVRDRIAGMILDGVLSPGELLPSVRSVAAELQVNPMTVHRGYQSLVDLGVIEADAGRGMLVLPRARDRLMEIERREFMQNEWPDVVTRVKRLGLDPQKLMRDLKGD